MKMTYERIVVSSVKLRKCATLFLAYSREQITKTYNEYISEMTPQCCVIIEDLGKMCMSNYVTTKTTSMIKHKNIGKI